MSDIKLIPNGTDIDLSGLEMTLVEGNDAIAQEVQIAMRFFRGEWQLDTRVGIPYFERILGQKNVSSNDIAVIYRQALLSIPGVAVVDSVLCSIDNAERRANVTWRAVTDENTIIEGQEALILP